MDDLELLKRFVETDDAEAFRLLVQEHGRMVLTTCRRRLRCAADAEDAAQDVFLLLIENARNIRSNVGGWLRRCAENSADHLLHVRMKQTRYMLQRAYLQSVLTEDRMAVEEEASVLESFLNGLEPIEHRLLLREYVAGKTQTEIASSLGISQQAVAKRITRAKRCLRHALATTGIDI